jgi:hypothetical protein
MDEVEVDLPLVLSDNNMPEIHEVVILEAMERLIQFTVDVGDAVEEYIMPAEITMTDQGNEVRDVMETIVGRTEEVSNAEEDMEIRFTIEIMVDEIILQVEEEILTLQELSNVHEESWIPVKQRSKDKAQERTG